MTSPLDRLLPYQRRWVDDESRFKMGLWSRQSGKSTACAAELVRTCLQHRGSNWIVLSAGERQALEFMEKVRVWAEAFHFSLVHYAEDRDRPQALLKSAEARWANGSRALALPANSSTARGYSGSVVLDEFAFHEKPERIWRALFPTISNALNGREKKLRIVTTPNGKGNKAHDLWSSSSFSKHFLPIQRAVEEGLPVDVAELRRNLGDQEGWAQEFECQFLDSSSVLLPYELIEPCESLEASEFCHCEVSPFKFDKQRWFMGVDFARKRDLSVAWTLERVGDVLWTREILVMRDMSTPAQFERLRSRLERVSRVCFDYTGSGVGLGDLLVQEYGVYDPARHQFGKVSLCHFTLGLKREIFPKLRLAFEQRSVRIPQSSETREDLHALRLTSLPGGGVTYHAPLTPHGHSDRAVALALALKAASEQPSEFYHQRVSVAQTRNF